MLFQILTIPDLKLCIRFLAVETMFEKFCRTPLKMLLAAETTAWRKALKIFAPKVRNVEKIFRALFHKFLKNVTTLVAMLEAIFEAFVPKFLKKLSTYFGQC